MAKRPDALGSKVSIKSLDDVDPILHELSWIKHETDRLNGLFSQKVDAIKLEFGDKYVCEVDGKSIDLKERTEYLGTILAEWVNSHLAKCLTEKKRSIKLPHGSVGLRQQPLVIELAKGKKDEDVLEAIDTECDGVVGVIKGWAIRRLKSFAGFVGDLLSIDVKPNLKKIKDAFEQQRLTKEQIEGLGLAVREAFDKPTVSVSEYVIES